MDRQTGVAIALRLIVACLLLLFGSSGCGANQATQPPGRPPTRHSVSQAEPGGDAHDPQEAALRRLLERKWGRCADKDGQVKLALPDRKNWKRVRFRGIDHFTGFRYGKAHRVVAAAFTVDMPPEAKVDSNRCMRRFETMARPQARSWKVTYEPIGSGGVKWRGQDLVVRFTEGHVETLFSRRKFSAAWVAYPAYPSACLIWGVAAQWKGHPELARQVRARFVAEGFGRTVTRTATKPYRH